MKINKNKIIREVFMRILQMPEYKVDLRNRLIVIDFDAFMSLKTELLTEKKI